MSRWDTALDWVRQPVSKALGSGQAQRDRNAGYAPGHGPPEGGGGGRGTVNKQRSGQRKQAVDRRTTLPPDLQRRIEQADGVPKPYDASFLKEIASHPVAQAYIDTMAQDAATAPWSITQRDERVEVDEDVMADAERTIEDLHPESSFRDLKEMAARNTLTLGDGAWVLHFFEGSRELAEAIPVDSSRLFKVVDEHGITRGYIEVSHTRRDITQRYDMDELVWFEWASQPGGVYGQGPVQKGTDTLEVLEELSEKELKDLTEGMPPGIVSVKEDEDTPMAVDAYENVKENWGLREGERHRAIVSMGDWDFTPLSPGYQDLQFLERNKFWIHVMGAVFKVNAPYAGFDFQEGNKAQNQAQAAAYAQRGFRVLLRQMEEAINRQLVWPHISEDLQFEFEMEQTAEEREQQAQYLQALADAAEKWDNLGREVQFRDGTIEIEDGQVEAPDEPEGAPGGLFGASAATGGVPEAQVDGTRSGQQQKADPMINGHDMDPGTGLVSCSETSTEFTIENATTQDIASDCPECGQPLSVLAEQKGGGGGLTREQYEKADDLLLEAHKSQIWPESVDDIEKSVWNSDEGVPEYVKDHISEAINRAKAVFQDIDSVPDQAQRKLEALLEENLTQDQGWSLKSIVDDMADTWPGVPKADLEVVARTETASVLNEAREIGYESFPDSGDDRFYWQGPDDSRTTDACEELKERTNPQHGGDPVTMNQLVREQEELQAQHFPNLSFRKHTLHPNERHTFVRQVGAAIDEAGF